MSELALRQFLFTVCLDKVTLHLGYFVSLIFVLTNTLRVESIHKEFKCKFWVKILYFSIFVIGSVYIVGRTFYWTSMMDGVINAEIRNTVTGLSLKELLSSSELWVLDRKDASIPRWIAFHAQSSVAWIEKILIRYLYLFVLPCASYIVFTELRNKLKNDAVNPISDKYSTDEP
jgi:hypothetical protein